MKNRTTLGLRPLVAAMALVATTAWANGTVQQLSGTISVQKPDGTTRVLARQSEVGKGDTLNTERDSYAQVKFSDGAVMTLKPNTRIKIEDFSFDEAQPAKDSSTLSLLKGGLRMITGLVGKRGNQDALRLGTATATIGIRGTTFTVDDCVSSACVKRAATRVGSLGGNEYAHLDTGTSFDFPEASADPEKFNAWVNLDRVLTNNARNPFALVGEKLAQAQAECAGDNCLAPAVYVGVSDGEILVRNGGGESSFRAGQFGQIVNFNSRPSTLPGDPGLPIYTPPATFFQNISGGGVRGSASQCVVN
jgi:hypothetical protein